MKKISKTYKITALSLALGLSAFSCTYDESDKIAGAGENSMRIVTSVDGDSGMFSSLASFDASPGSATFIELRRDAVTNADLQESVTATIQIDNKIVDTYNHDYVDAYNADVDAYNEELDVNGDGIDDLDPKDHIDYYTIVDPTRYVLSTTSVTFAPGEFAKYIPMQFNPTDFDFSLQYALGVRLINPTGDYKVSNVGAESFVKVVVKNQFDGKYSYTGSIGRYDAGGNALGDGLDGPIAKGVSVNLSTLGASELDFPTVWASGSGGIGGVGAPSIVVNADNTIVLKANGASPANWGPIAGDPAKYPNKYDPATKTFYINWKWGGASGSPSGTTRALMLVLTYQGAR